MPSPRALIADDERLMRDQLRGRLAAAWPELQIVAEARSGGEALALFEMERPELAFLDIRMPAPNGLEVARQICRFPNSYLQYHKLRVFQSIGMPVDYALALEQRSAPHESAEYRQGLEASLRTRLPGL